MKTGKSKTFSESLKELKKITDWFEDQETVDIEEGLAKYKQGMELVKDLKKRLKFAENEFKELAAGEAEES